MQNVDSVFAQFDKDSLEATLDFERAKNSATEKLLLYAAKLALKEHLGDAIARENLFYFFDTLKAKNKKIYQKFTEEILSNGSSLYLYFNVSQLKK